MEGNEERRRLRIHAMTAFLVAMMVPDEYLKSESLSGAASGDDPQYVGRIASAEVGFAANARKSPRLSSANDNDPTELFGAPGHADQT